MDKSCLFWFTLCHNCICQCHKFHEQGLWQFDKIQFGSIWIAITSSWYYLIQIYIHLDKMHWSCDLMPFRDGSTRMTCLQDQKEFLPNEVGLQYCSKTKFWCHKCKVMTVSLSYWQEKLPIIITPAYILNKKVVKFWAWS